jgi:hypothetical protein
MGGKNYGDNNYDIIAVAKKNTNKVTYLLNI